MTLVIYCTGSAEMNYRIRLTFIVVLIMGIRLTIAPAADESLKISNLKTVSYLTYQQLTEIPKITEYVELYCYSNLVTSGEWGGLLLFFI